MSKQYVTLHTLDDAHITDIFSLAATPATLFSASGASTLNIHDTTQPEFPVKQSISGAHRQGIHHVCTARHGPGRHAATAGFGGDIKVWALKDNGDWALDHELPRENNGRDDVWAIALSADEEYLAVTTNNGDIHIWHGTERFLTYSPNSGSKGAFAMSVDMSRDGRYTASGHQNGSIYVFSNQDGRIAWSLSGLVKPVRAVSFAPGGKRLAAAGDAGVIALYDMQNGEHVGNLSPKGTNNAWITSLDWNDTGEYLLSGSLDGKVRVWDVNRGECVTTRSETDKAIWSVRWLPVTNKPAVPGMGKGEIFCTAGADRSISFYREATGA